MRLTVFLAAVLFLVGISSHFPVRVARYGLLALASLMLLVSVVQLLGPAGPARLTARKRCRTALPEGPRL